MRLALAAAVLVAHFTATSVSGTATRACGSVTATNATYSGSGTTIVARSAIDSVTGKGVVTGTLRTESVKAEFSAVYDHGTIEGTATGHIGRRSVVTSLSAVFSPTGGFTYGVLGGRGAGGSAILDSSCGAPPQQVLRHAQGVVKVSNAAQVVVGGLACVVPTSLAVTVAFSHPAGSWAAITCSVSNGESTLVTIQAKK